MLSTARPGLVWPFAMAAMLLLAGSLWLFWPGVAMFDTVAQYRQVVSGSYDDWHPPAMARLWAVLRDVAGNGAEPMLVVQLGLYWLGLGVIAAALARAGRAGAGACALGIGLLPPFLGWQAVVLKDTQMAGALLAATGLVAWWRVAGRRAPVLVILAAAILLAYATLVRANAVFAAVPLAVLLAPWPRSAAARVAVALLGIAAVLAVAPLINHRLLAAEPSGVERTEALYDLSGIAARSPTARGTGVTPAERAQLIARRCVRPFFWDPLGEPTRCDGVVERLREIAPGRLYATLAGAMLAHPLAYAAHRLAHVNSTERWWVPARWPDAAPPDGSEPNDLGLGAPGAAAAAWQGLAAVLVETPLGWPFAWVAVALATLAGAWRAPASGERTLALALLGSALTLEASFAGLSIASDLRYHMWPMVATALAVVLAGPPAAGSRTRAVALGAIALMVGVGVVARLTLPAPPQSYRAMLG